MVVATAAVATVGVVCQPVLATVARSVVGPDAGMPQIQFIERLDVGQRERRGQDRCDEKTLRAGQGYQNAVTDHGFDGFIDLAVMSVVVGVGGPPVGA